jgi:predicted nucleic acid-binding protein
MVMDNSSTMAWLLREETMANHDEFGQRLRARGAVVPMHWKLEIANALVQGVRRNKVDQPDVETFLTALGLLPIEIDQQTAQRVWDESLTLAQKHHLSVYDAAYLELAIRRSLPLATLDKALAKAARAEGIKVIGG